MNTRLDHARSFALKAQPSDREYAIDELIKAVREEPASSEPSAIEVIAADCKDIDSFLDQIEAALKKFGLTVVYPSQYEGSDQVAIAVSDKPFTQEDLDGMFMSL